MTRFICDVCGEDITKDDPGVIHGLEWFEDTEGFCFWKWDASLALAAIEHNMGHVHRRCIGVQVQKYMTKYDLGRLVLPGAHVTITQEKMKNRQSGRDSEVRP